MREQNLGAADRRSIISLHTTLPSEFAHLASMHRRTIKSAVPEEWPPNAFMTASRTGTD